MTIKKQFLAGTLIGSMSILSSIPAHSSPIQLGHQKPVIGYITDKFGAAFITVNDKAIIAFKETIEDLSPKQQAFAVARHLNELQFDHQLSPEKLEVIMDKNIFKAQIGTYTLFAITKDMARPYNKSAAALSLEWVDQLRIALGAPPSKSLQFQSGKASWYGRKFHGRKTASGERYNMNSLTAAHRFLPFGTRVLVTNTNNNQSVMVRINDRGPFIAGRIIDLSPAAFKRISHVGRGILNVKLRVVSPR